MSKMSVASCLIFAAGQLYNGCPSPFLFVLSVEQSVQFFGGLSKGKGSNQMIISEKNLGLWLWTVSGMKKCYGEEKAAALHLF